MATRQQLSILYAARAGDTAAQLALGQLYLSGGDGVQRNLITALHWLDRAAHQNVAYAWVLIGKHIPFPIAHRSGKMAQLAIWYEKAFDAGDVEAGLVFAQIVQAITDFPVPPDTMKKALHALHAAARAGIAEAQWILAQHPEQPALDTTSASPPSKHNSGRSLEWTISAAEGGIDAARYQLAEKAWGARDFEAYLHWSLPLARNLTLRPIADRS